ncbi:MAG: FixH family protein [Hyphomonadaceae bacterium]|nr:FixH family protein [Hyphomonadaceae bacterium]
MTDTAPRKSRELKGWHVLIIMLGFFGVMFAVNGVFLYYAITSHPGEQVEKSYAQGLNYNDQLEARARQAELGWTGALGIMAGENQVPVLVAQISDAGEQPLGGLDLSAKLHRHSTSDADVHLALTPSIRGEYSVSLEGLPAGDYDVIVTATRGGGEDILFEAHKRLYLP